MNWILVLTHIATFIIGFVAGVVTLYKLVNTLTDKNK